MDKKGLFFPTLIIIILSILTLLLIIVNSGKGALSRTNIETYLKEQKTIFTKEQKKDIEDFAKEKGIPIEIVDYIDTNEEIKKLADKIILDIYDYNVNNDNIEFLEEKIVLDIKKEIEIFESKYSNIDVWKYVEEPVKEIVEQISLVYEEKVPKEIEIVFMIFSENMILILIILIVLCILLLLIFRRIWGLFYIAIPGFISAMIGHYLANQLITTYTVKGITIPESIINNVKEIANDTIAKIFAISVILLIVFALYFVIKYITHKINIRIKANKM